MRNGNGELKPYNKRIYFFLMVLRQVYEDGVMPSMIDDGDHEERINEIEDILTSIKL